MSSTEDIFDKIGRKTPYTTPGGYFGQQRERLLDISRSKKKNTMLFRRIMVAASVVAVVAVGFMLFRGVSAIQPAEYLSVDDYLASLSDDDLAYSVEIAEYDIFYETDSLTNY